MKNKKDNVWLLSLGGMAILILGMIIGFRFNNSNVESLQGYLYRGMDRSTHSNASNSNASSSNATNSNAWYSWYASSPNASDANASSSNASSPNAGASYNIIMLGSFSILDHEVNARDKVGILLDTSGACLNGATLFFSNDDGSNQFAAPVRETSEMLYFEVPSTVVSDEYHLISLMLVGINSDGTTFSRHFSTAYYGRQRLAVNNNVSSMDLEYLKLVNTTVAAGGKVDVVMDSSIVPDTARFTFRTKDKLSGVFVTLRSIDDKPYFTVSSSAKPGTYYLTEVMFTTEDGIKIYKTDTKKQDEKLKFDISLEITEAQEESYVYDGEVLNGEDNSKIFYSIYNAPDKIEVTINADSNSLILDELFNSIKGSNKTLVINYNDNQLVFNGKDIENSKTIDASIRVAKVNADDNIGGLIKDGIIVNFSDNGVLPGKAVVRVKNSNLVKSSLAGNDVYVYLYDDASQKFVEVTEDKIKLEDGYYEFEIDHNSSYVLVTDKIEEDLVAEETGKVVTFTKSDNTYIIIALVGLLIVVVAALIIFLVKRRKNDDFFEEEKDNKPKKDKKEKKETR